MDCHYVLTAYAGWHRKHLKLHITGLFKGNPPMRWIPLTRFAVQDVTMFMSRSFEPQPVSMLSKQTSRCYIYSAQIDKYYSDPCNGERLMLMQLIKFFYRIFPDLRGYICPVDPSKRVRNVEIFAYDDVVIRSCLLLGQNHATVIITIYRPR